MRLVQTYIFKPGSKLPFSEWPRIVRQFLEEQGLSCGRFLYYFEDAAPLKGLSRAGKDCPSLGAPEFVPGSVYHAADRWMLSNIHRPTACTEADLLPLMKRIHRSYGFTQADLFYLDVDFFGQVVPMERDMTDARNSARWHQQPLEERLFLDRQPRGSGFRLHRDILGNNALTVTMDLLRDGQVLDPTPYYDALQALLPGMRCQAYRQILLTGEEQAALEELGRTAAPLFEQIRAFFESRLPPEQGQAPFAQYKLAPALKRLCRQHDRICRFVRDGVFYMDRQAGPGQLLRLTADSGPSRSDVGFYLDFIGVGYSHRLYTAVLTPKDQTGFDAAAVRVFEAVAEFETEYLSRLTAHFPAAPDWYASAL